MENKCPNCGFNYDEFDLFCARCGAKLKEDSIDEFDEVENEKTNENKNDSKIRSFNQPFSMNSSKNNHFDGILLNFVTFLLILVVALSFVVNFILKKHDERRSELQYRNLIQNPAQIPQLKEPASFVELSTNLSEVEHFLLLYLKYSTDSIDKKEQIFASYLNELDKLPRIANESLIKESIEQCASISTPQRIKSCNDKLNARLKQTGMSAYHDYNKIYLYPNNVFIRNKFSRYVSKPFEQYLDLRAKYSEPTSLMLNLYIKPKKLADKIYDFEKLFVKTDNAFVKDEIEKTLYDDFRKFIFTPSIYATTTQEMKKEFKSAYLYFLAKKRNSALYPVVMSYIDKKRSYGEENFKNDYPYKMFEDKNFDENVEQSYFSDIFAKLRKNSFSNNFHSTLSYIYNIQSATWRKYEQNMPIAKNEYVATAPDENNNISFFNSSFSPMGELNILKYGKLCLINNNLYIFNQDKLALSRLIFNGKVFNVYMMSQSDVTSLFPGIEVIYIDSYSSYNIYIEKDNAKANYILLSRYMTGWDNYQLTPIRGNVSNMILPNMFSVNSNSDVIISFHNSQVNPEETSDNTPTYRIIVHTKGQPSIRETRESPYVQYDEKTAHDEDDEDLKTHEPKMMPKIPEKDNEMEQNELLTPPKQNIEPPFGEND